MRPGGVLHVVLGGEVDLVAEGLDGLAHDDLALALAVVGRGVKVVDTQLVGPPQGGDGLVFVDVLAVGRHGQAHGAKAQRRNRGAGLAKGTVLHSHPEFILLGAAAAQESRQDALILLSEKGFDLTPGHGWSGVTIRPRSLHLRHRHDAFQSLRRSGLVPVSLRHRSGYAIHAKRQPGIFLREVEEPAERQGLECGREPLVVPGAQLAEGLPGGIEVFLCPARGPQC